jgi:putative phosphoesterase
VLSDSHDNIWRLDEALPYMKAADAVIHCGDIVAPFMVRRMGKALDGIALHIVWGNNDGDKFFIAKIASAFPNITLHGEMAELDLQGIAVAVNHFPHIARGLARSGQYGMVCHGHDHTAHEEWVGDCLLLNPGELMGLKGRSTLAVVELPQRKVQWVEFPTAE